MGHWHVFRHIRPRVLLLPALAIAAALLFAAVKVWIPGLPFFPTKTIAATPADMEMPYGEVRIPTSDGEVLSAWFIPGAPGRGPGAGLTLLFFHGNSGNISSYLRAAAIFHQLGLDVLMPDYRGFGNSTGLPSVEGTQLDAMAAWEWLLRVKELRPDQIIIHGRSLGGGVAAYLASQAEPRALILESTFTSLYDVIKTEHPWLPVSLLFDEETDYDVRDSLAGLRIPLLVVHSPDDELVHYALGRALYESYAGPKRLLRLKGSHDTGYLEDKEDYINGLRNFLKSLNKPS